MGLQTSWERDSFMTHCHRFLLKVCIVSNTVPVEWMYIFILKWLKLNAVLHQIILAEKQKSIHGSGEHWSVKDQRVRGAVEIDPDTPIKLIRKGVVR